MATSAESSNPGQAIGDAYHAVEEILKDIQPHQAAIDRLNQQKQEQISTVEKQLHGSELPEEAKIFAAALLRLSHTSLEQMHEHVERLTDIDERTKENQGQTALWFSTTTKFVPLYIQFHDKRPPAPSESDYAIDHYLHLGTLAHDASLRANLNASEPLSIPLLKKMTIEVWARPEEDQIDLERPLLAVHTATGSTRYKPEDNPHITIPVTDESLDKFMLIMGDAAVEQAIASAPEKTQQTLRDMRDQLANASS